MKVSRFAIQGLAQHMGQGGVVACPAEAVWGLSCDPFCESAVDTVLALKQRSVTKGLIVVAGDIDMLAPILAPLPAPLRAELEMSWPGGNTWLLPNRGMFPPWITGDSEEVAVRVTGAPSLKALSCAFGGPVVSTSANPAGAQPARQGFQVVRYFGPNLPRARGSVDATAKPSTIRRLGTGEVLRA
ncbi:MAG: L-threonylcarbamoyladenylate synthase [Luminiphilus sp.]